MGMLVRRVDGRQHALSVEQVVGRLPSCDLRLTDKTVSGAHALVRWHCNVWEIRDLGSHNGTRVDSRALGAGESMGLALGNSITFGDPTEEWHLIDVAPPVVQVVPTDGGAAVSLKDTTIAIPDAANPQCTVFHNGLTWQLEEAGQSRQVRHNDTFGQGGREWRFECPDTGTITPAMSSRPSFLREVQLCFCVSADEERVGLQLQDRAGPRELQARGCFYLGLVLARHRLAEEEQGITDPGWLDVVEVLRMIPEYASQSHLNVDIHRLRREVGAAGIADAGNIIERRPRRVRFGTTLLRIEREG